MAQLSPNPDGLELEDFVAAHFKSRGVYVETSIRQWDPDAILELDIVWTDYSKGDIRRNPVEIKSGHWGLGDLFKFYGWIKYLEIPAGQYVFRNMPDRINAESLNALCSKLDICPLHIENISTVDDNFKAIGLSNPTEETLPILWRYSYWAQRKLLKSLSASIKYSSCIESGKKAKIYAKLINDALFFEPDVRSRVSLLLDAHQNHPKLALTAANEIGGRGVDFLNPRDCPEFRTALYGGLHFPIQACLYLSHRARLSILKAMVEYHILRERGELPIKVIKIHDTEYEVDDLTLPLGLNSIIEKLSVAKSFRLFPVFWQTFLWGWGGFILTDRIDEEYHSLSLQTGVPKEEIDLALSVFNELYESASPWIIKPEDDFRKVVKLIPAPMRGIGAYNRLLRYKKNKYEDLGLNETTTKRFLVDNNSLVMLLDGDDEQIAK